MQKEVNKLQERLGVPLDDQFDDEDYGLGKDVPDTEVLDEKEEIVEESTSCTEIPKKETSNDDEKCMPQDEDIKHEDEEFEDNYSDSFSDLSQSDEEKIEHNNNSDSEEIASDNKELIQNSSSDSGKNFRKSASNSDIESDLEISEAS